MRWQNRRGSENVEDRRSMRGPAVAGGGVVGLIVVLIVIFLGGDPRPLLNQMQNNQPAPNAGVNPGPNPREDKMAQFVSVVLADTEDVWTQLFTKHGEKYRKPKLVLFRGRVESACGFQSAATGPFYCPADMKVYIDLSFYDDMQRELGAPGDFARAYVIAHEVGHHVQNLLGINKKVHAQQRLASKQKANQLSVRLELQADYFAGVWAHHAQRNWKILEEGDIEEAINAATAIGDDRLQKRARGYVVPESFTHGTSAQRVRWFMKGFRSGNMLGGNTFKVKYEDL